MLDNSNDHFVLSSEILNYFSSNQPFSLKCHWLLFFLGIIKLYQFKEVSLHLVFRFCHYNLVILYMCTPHSKQNPPDISLYSHRYFPQGCILLTLNGWFLWSYHFIYIPSSKLHLYLEWLISRFAGIHFVTKIIWSFILSILLNVIT